MTELKRPHEDVRGVDRDDWLLSLDERAVAHREALMAIAHHLYDATLVGNAAPKVERMAERMRHPQTGDFVMEQSTFYRFRDPDHRLKMFGVLLDKRTEYRDTDEEWAQMIADEEVEPDEERPAQEIWYIQYGSAAVDICRWENCMFIAVPTAREFFDHPPVGTRDGNGVVFTRNDLLGSLADAGFQLKGVGQ